MNETASLCKMKMTLTYRAGARDPLGLKNQIESLCSFWFKSVVIWVWSSDRVDLLGLVLVLSIKDITSLIHDHMLLLGSDQINHMDDDFR